MVNVGGPSKGCVTCIRRKIRCDRQRPVCGQCQKSKKQCEGYRNETDLMFRDQSQMMFARVLATPERLSKLSEEPANSEISSTPQGTSKEHRAHPESDKATTVIRSPKLNAESGLVTFFANNFTCSDSNRGSNLFWVPNNFDDLLKNGAAKSSVQSVGAMALARLQRSSYYHREAQKSYGLALLNLTNLWQQPVEMDKNAIFITILFLGFFEILASYDSSSSRQSWTTHLGGLGLLLRRRDEGFFASDFGARMLLQSRTQAILNALQTKSPVPEVFRMPNKGIQSTMSPHVVQSERASMLLISLATLQAQHQLSGSSEALIADLFSLNARLRSWMESVPSSWSFSPQPSEFHSSLWWEARCDVYPTAIVAHIWNQVRTARIIVHDLIQETRSQLLPYGINDTGLALHQTSQEIPAPEVRHLVTDICATVPVYYWPSSAKASSDKIGDRPLLGTAYWLLWTLEVLGSMREAPLTLRAWTLACLKRIHDTTGIEKAKLAADRIDMRN